MFAQFNYAYNNNKSLIYIYIYIYIYILIVKYMLVISRITLLICYKIIMGPYIYVAQSP